jgi:hypothetical protein
MPTWRKNGSNDPDPRKCWDLVPDEIIPPTNHGWVYLLGLAYVIGLVFAVASIIPSR